MSKKILLIIILALAIFVGLYLNFVGSEDSIYTEPMKIDFMINDKIIEDASKFIGQPKKEDQQKVYVDTPYKTIVFEPTFDIKNLDITNLKWKFKANSIDTTISGKAKISKYFHKQDNCLVSLCYNQRCISKWIYIVDEKTYSKLNNISKVNAGNQIAEKSKEIKTTKEYTIESKSISNPQIDNVSISDKYNNTEINTSDNSKESLVLEDIDTKANDDSKADDINQIIPQVEEEPIRNTDQPISNNEKTENGSISKTSNLEIDRESDNTSSSHSSQTSTINNIKKEEKKDFENDSSSAASIKKKKSNQIGINIVDKCPNLYYTKSTKMIIEPLVDLTLTSFYVISNDIGKIEIIVTSTDGTNESINVNLNSGRNQVLLSELYLDLKKGKTYTLYAKAKSYRESIETKLKNAKNCGKSSFSDENINIKFNDSVCFFNIKYTIL